MTSSLREPKCSCLSIPLFIAYMYVLGHVNLHKKCVEMALLVLISLYYDAVAFGDVTNLCAEYFLSFPQLTVFGRHGATGCHVTSAAAVATRVGHVTATRRCTEVKVVAAARRRRGKSATHTAVPVGGAAVLGRTCWTSVAE